MSGAWQGVKRPTRGSQVARGREGLKNICEWWNRNVLSPQFAYDILKTRDNSGEIEIVQANFSRDIVLKPPYIIEGKIL